jgi:hypothetical protein
LRLGGAARKQLAELIAGATSLRGDFFRSVAFRYFHPDDVIRGEETRLYGGRFVPVGVRAVYASLEEETALREVTIRKSALGGRGQIAVGVSTDEPISSLWRRIETFILPRRFNRSWLTSFGSVCGGSGILSRRNWRPSGFQRVSTVSFFRLRQALAEMLQCI